MCHVSCASVRQHYQLLDLAGTCKCMLCTTYICTCTKEHYIVTLLHATNVHAHVLHACAAHMFMYYHMTALHKPLLPQHVCKCLYVIGFKGTQAAKQLKHVSVHVPHVNSVNTIATTAHVKATWVHVQPQQGVCVSLFVLRYLLWLYHVLADRPQQMPHVSL